MRRGRLKSQLLFEDGKKGEGAKSCMYELGRKKCILEGKLDTSHWYIFVCHTKVKCGFDGFGYTVYEYTSKVKIKYSNTQNTQKYSK